MSNIQGKVLMIGETNQVSAKFRKRDLVVEFAENPMYPQKILFQLTQAKCDLIEEKEIKVGQLISVEYNLRGRDWISPDNKTLYFNTLEAWKLEVVAQAEPAPIQGKEAIEDADVLQTDDLPF